ncbi:MAG: DUF881 domain-containing protein [Thermaerobacter sp.]|nr:DUF881 domain-containing protein [Thermaerobacter sp.]
MWALLGIVVLLGVLLGVQFRVDRGVPAVGPENIGEMAVLLLHAERQDQTLSREVASLKEQLLGRAQGVARYKTLLQQLNQARAEAGLTKVTGKGVEVVMTEPPAGPGGNGIFSIHDTDVLMILNELRAAGAYALSINGHRVVATTEVRQAGSIFSINDSPAAPPFTIIALGNPTTLQQALQLRGGVADTLEAVGIGVKVKASAQLEVPAYQGADLP